MIEVVPETDSTNARLSARLRAGEAVPAGHWLVADRQSAGRGRQGRDWADGEGNFMGSTVVPLHDGDPPASSLALVAGLAVYETVLPRLGLPGRLQLKWPNDLMLADGKLAGILLEREGDAVIAGIGVNLARAPELPGRRAVALAQFGPAPDRDAFAAELAANFDAEVGRWRTFGLERIIARWLAAAHPIGTPLSVHEPGGKRISGSFEGLAADGALSLRLADGSLRAIHAGEVMLEEH